MKITRTILILLTALTLAATPVTFTSCKSTEIPGLSANASDQVVLRAEQTAETAKLTFTTFVHIERDNEAILNNLNPAIHQYANFVRAHGLDYIVSLRNATKAFKANRTPENQANLNTLLSTLTTMVGEVNKYITQTKTVTGV